MKIKSIVALSIIAITIDILASGCHTRKAAGTKSTVPANVAVPASSVRAADTTNRTPAPKITPTIAPNTRPDPTPDPQPPVPPM